MRNLSILVILACFLYNAPASGGVVRLTGTITESSAMEVLRGLEDGQPSYTIVINSGGGLVSMGELIIDKIRELDRRGVKITCAVEGYAMSMAFSVLTACPYRTATSQSSVMFHQIRSYVTNYTTDELTSFAARTAARQNRLDSMHIEALGVTQADYYKHLNHETIWPVIAFKAWAPKFQLDIVDIPPAIK